MNKSVVMSDKDITLDKKAEESWRSKGLWYVVNADERAYKTGFKDGYRKAKKDANKMKSRFLKLCNLKDIRIKKLEETNEWHYVEDGDLPKENKPILISDIFGHCESGYYFDGDWFGRGVLFHDVFAWRDCLPQSERMKLACEAIPIKRKKMVRKPRLINANDLMDYCQNLIDKKIDCNDIARFPTYPIDEWHYPSKGELPKEDNVEKENNLLKQKLDALDCQVPWEELKNNSELIKENLKAREIIEGLLNIPDLIEDRTIEHTELIGEAEQFLKGDTL